MKNTIRLIVVLLLLGLSALCVPGCAPEEKNNKSLQQTVADVPLFSYAAVTYTVPTGNTLYITSVSGHSYASNAGDAPTQPVCEVRLDINGSPVVSIRGNGRASHSFSKPYKVSAGKELTVYAFNRAPLLCDITASMNGFENKQIIGANLQPGWATEQGQFKYLTVAGSAMAFGDYAYTECKVPSGKVLLGCGCYISYNIANGFLEVYFTKIGAWHD